MGSPNEFTKCSFLDVASERLPKGFPGGPKGAPATFLHSFWSPNCAGIATTPSARTKKRPKNGNTTHTKNTHQTISKWSPRVRSPNVCLLDVGSSKVSQEVPNHLVPQFSFLDVCSERIPKGLPGAPRSPWTLRVFWCGFSVASVMTPMSGLMPMSVPLRPDLMFSVGIDADVRRYRCPCQYRCRCPYRPAPI